MNGEDIMLPIGKWINWKPKYKTKNQIGKQVQNILLGKKCTTY